MKAELRQVTPPVDAASECLARTVVFTAADARRALRYVAPIAREAIQAYCRVQSARKALDDAPSAAAAINWCDARDAALAELNAVIDELNAVGADLIDMESGVVRFAAMIDDRPVSLLWRVGEPIETAWNGLR